ncbi:MAG: T9SS type A sorting domain-containing protein [Deltaproteobacteria bacterium]|nr:T9SS type A sorting domain-containing protein [Deltaproteobacteria bacterium]
MSCKCLFFFTLYSLSLALSSCGPSYPPDTDATRSYAMEIPLNSTADDRVAFYEKDKSDWKRFTISEKTTALINIHWDDPEITRQVNLYDQFGGKMRELNHQKGVEKDSIKDISFNAGTYFVEITAQKGSSVYTVEVLTGDMTQGTGYGIPRPE